MDPAYPSVTVVTTLGLDPVTSQPASDITNKQLADKLEGLLMRTCRVMNETWQFYDPVLLDGKFEVKLVSWTMYDKCPVHACTFSENQKLEATLKNRETGKEIIFPGTIAHTIRAHSHFQNLDRAEACSVLELQNGEDYTPKTVPSYDYRQLSHIASNDHDYLERINAVKRRWTNILETQRLGENTLAYLVEDASAPVEFLYNGNAYRAKLYIQNMTGEELPKDGYVFGIRLSTLYRNSHNKDLTEYEIKSKTQYVLDPRDKTLHVKKDKKMQDV